MGELQFKSFGMERKNQENASLSNYDTKKNDVEIKYVPNNLKLLTLGIFHKPYAICQMQYAVWHMSYIIYHIHYIVSHIYHISYIIYHISYLRDHIS